MRKVLFLIVLCLGFCQVTSAQMSDKWEGNVSVGVTGPKGVTLKNVKALLIWDGIGRKDTIRHSEIKEGRFIFKDVFPTEVFVMAVADGFEAVLDTVKVVRGITVRKDLELKQRMLTLKQVTVKGRAPAMIYKGDTILMNPLGVNVLEDDDVRQILEQMPGVDINENSVAVQGHQIERTYVDGKKTFGDDPMTAIDHVSGTNVVNIKAYSEENRDDQKRGKQKRHRWVLDVITKTKMINSRDGSVLASAGRTLGTDTKKNRYALGGAFNFFSEKKLITANVMHNNQNISSNNPMFFLQSANVWPQYSENSMAGFGLHNTYSDSAFINQLDISYNFTRKAVNSRSTRERDFFATDAYQNRLYQSVNDAWNQNNRHAFSLYLDKKWGTRYLSFQINPKFDHNRAVTTQLIDDVTDGMRSRSQITSSEYGKSKGIESTLMYWQSFKFAQATLDAKIQHAESDVESHNRQTVDGQTLQQRITPTSKLDNVIDVEADLSTNFGVSKDHKWGPWGGVRVKLYNSHGHNYQQSWDELTGTVDSINTYSYRSDLITWKPELHLGMSTYEGSNRITGTVGFGQSRLQDLDLESDAARKYHFSTMDITFAGLFHINHSKTELSFDYSLKPVLPDVMQLRSELNNANLLFLSTGNPDLKPSKPHTLNLYGNFILGKRGTSLWTATTFTSTHDYITGITRYFKEPTYLSTWKVTAPKGSSLNTLTNINGHWSVRQNLRWVQPLSAIKSSFTVMLADEYSHIPYYFDTQRDRTSVNDFKAEVSFKSSFFPNTVMSLKNEIDYRTASAAVSPSRSRIFTERLGAQLQLKKLFKYFFLNVNYDFTTQHLITMNRTENAHLLNLYGGVKLFKRMGEISITAYDLLNSFMDKRFVNTSNYTEMVSNTNFGRYVAINFAYKFRNVKTPRATMQGVNW